MAISDPQIFKRDQPSLLLPNRTAKSPTLHLSIPRMFTVNFFFLGYIKFEGISNHRQVRAFSPRSLPLNSPLPGNRYNLSIWFALKTSCKMIKLKGKIGISLQCLAHCLHGEYLQTALTRKFCLQHFFFYSFIIFIFITRA